jgi:hypothetical protein
MFGHGCPVGGADFCEGAGVLVEGAGVVVEGAELVGAAAAPAMPIAAPPVASAPTTIVAVSGLEMCIVSSLQCVLVPRCCAAIVCANAKRRRMSFVGVV